MFTIQLLVFTIVLELLIFSIVLEDVDDAALIGSVSIALFKTYVHVYVHNKMLTCDHSLLTLQRSRSFPLGLLSTYTSPRKRGWQITRLLFDVCFDRDERVFLCNFLDLPASS